MMRFCPSTYPSSRRPSRNASTRLASRDGEEFPRYPIVTVRPVLDSVSLAARGMARRPSPRPRTMRRHNGLRLEKILTVLPPPPSPSSARRTPAVSGPGREQRELPFAEAWSPTPIVLDGLSYDLVRSQQDPLRDR